MKVKVGNNVYDGEIEPVMVILSSGEREQIANMAPEATKYCMYPATEDWIKDDYAKIKAWMQDGEEEGEVIYEKYEHHGAMVWVRTDLKGLHRQHCLCFAPCAKFKPGQDDNCLLAQENYEMCVRHNMTLPVWECPEFIAAMSQ